MDCSDQGSGWRDRRLFQRNPVQVKPLKKMSSNPYWMRASSRTLTRITPLTAAFQDWAATVINRYGKTIRRMTSLNNRLCILRPHSLHHLGGLERRSCTVPCNAQSKIIPLILNRNKTLLYNRILAKSLKSPLMNCRQASHNLMVAQRTPHS